MPKKSPTKSPRRTRIVATIGPASESQQVLHEMVAAGMDVARLNFSHGTYQHHAMLIRRIRAAAKKAGREVGIMADLQGPKLRLGAFTRPEVKLSVGQQVRFVYEPKIAVDVEATGTLPLQIDLISSMRAGEQILLSDGTIECRVIAREKKAIRAEVTVGGVLRPHAGFNLPSTRLELEALSLKDRADLAFALEQGVDMVALSFVRSATDVERLRRLISRLLKRSDHLPLIVSKIEKPQAVEEIDRIIAVSDAIMIARGDLGIEVPMEQVPLIQKDIIRRCLSLGKPTIVATQMLDSMIANARPTRAEVSDVANAVIDHTDAIMLSAESAVGRYPVESVATMAKIASQTEISPLDDLLLSTVPPEHYAKSLTAHLANSAVAAALGSGARVLMCATASGFTARMLARFRPDVPILAITHDPMVARQLCLSWGVRPVVITGTPTGDAMSKKMLALAQKLDLLKVGDIAVLLTGYGTTTQTAATTLSLQKST